MPEIRTSTSSRGSLIQGTRATFFIRITELEGGPRNPSSISYQILDSFGSVVQSGSPEKTLVAATYAIDWDISASQTTGNYEVEWTYVVDGDTYVYVQSFIVAASVAEISPPSLYNSRIAEFRMALGMMLGCAQGIPVYRHIPKKSSDGRTFVFPLPRWNPTTRMRIYVDNEPQTYGVSVDYDEGIVTFDEDLSIYETVEADYSHKWFSDMEMDRFLSDGVHLTNLYPPVYAGMTLMNLKEEFIPLVLRAAAIQAIRNIMMCLQFQQPQYIFGGPDEAAKAFANFETLKKNYEEEWNKAIEAKKYGSYVGLTKTIVTPAMSLPGGASRWFRYMFSSSN